MDSLRRHPAVQELVPDLESSVHDGKFTASLAARAVLDAFGIARS